MKIKNIETVHKNPFFNVTKEEFIRHDGKPSTYYVVNKCKTVFVIPISLDGSVYLIKQYRYATKTWGWELPAGGIDEDELPLIAAKRELVEETGLTAKSWDQPGIIHITPGMSNDTAYLFVARQLTMGSSNEQKEEGITDCKRFSIPEIKDMIISGEIHGAPTMACLARIFWAD